MDHKNLTHDMRVTIDHSDSYHILIPTSKDHGNLSHATPQVTHDHDSHHDSKYVRHSTSSHESRSNPITCEKSYHIDQPIIHYS